MIDLDCDACEGSGDEMEWRESVDAEEPWSGYVRTGRRCPECDGRGYVWVPTEEITEGDRS